jgi:DNA-binding NarL/FixJ family response regulator
MTTSKAAEDIVRTFEPGVNSSVTKSATFETLVHAIKLLRGDGSEIVVLPIKA